MEQYVIKGGNPLYGEVEIGGAKNAALAILAAAIMTDETVTIDNLPNVRDINVLLQAIEEIGAHVERVDIHKVKINGSFIRGVNVDNEFIRRIRASYYLIGALLGKYKHAEVALPGGCDIGSRPIDLHMKGFRSMGADIDIAHGLVIARAKELKGTHIYMDKVSVGATINIMMAAAMADGKTVIGNAAKEPHVVDVANFLNTMGANIRGAGTDIIRIQGREHLHGCNYAVIPDQIEAGTYMIAAAATRGDVILNNVIPTHLESLSAKLIECGVEVITGDNGNDFYMEVRTDKRPEGVTIKTMPYPGFPTDLQQPMTSMLATANGTSVITENLFESRFNHVAELNRMGADINIYGRNANINGVEKIYGTDVKTTDLRAGAAMIIAALMAEGTTRIHNLHYIDRGYERIEEKLRALGANIKRVSEE